MNNYKATYDKGARWITGVYILSLTLLLGFSLSGIKGTSGLSIAAAVLMLIGLITLRYSVRYYQLSTEGIIVCRYSGKKLIPRVKIQQVKVLSPVDLKDTMRTMGVGGLFGYYGKFSNNKLGDMTWYITNRQHPVGIFFDNENTIVISPDDGERFYKDWIAAGVNPVT